MHDDTGTRQLSMYLLSSRCLDVTETVTLVLLSIKKDETFYLKNILQ
jgi:hypothetical protein